MDHGVVAALLALKRTHQFYEDDQSFDVRDFYYEIVDSATAIFLHNFYFRHMFGQGIGYEKFCHDFPNPLGYLLCLCDTLCEWQRNNQF